MHKSRKSRRTTSSGAQAKRPRRIFMAAVRYPDGRRELVRVKNADDLDDAREVVRDHLGDVHVLITECDASGDEGSA